MGKGERHLLLNGIKTLLFGQFCIKSGGTKWGDSLRFTQSLQKVVFSDVKTKKSDLSRSVPLGAHSVPCINERKNSILCSKKIFFSLLKFGLYKCLEYKEVRIPFTDTPRNI